jgi:hypothetical protein
MIHARSFNLAKIVHFQIEMITQILTYMGFRPCLTYTMAEPQG